MSRRPLRYEDLGDDDFTPDAELTVVERWDDVPQFASEEEAAHWWDSHSLADHLWSKDRRGPPERFAERARAERKRRELAEGSWPRASRLASPSLDDDRVRMEMQAAARVIILGAIVFGAAWIAFRVFMDTRNARMGRF